MPERVWRKWWLWRVWGTQEEINAESEVDTICCIVVLITLSYMLLNKEIYEQVFIFLHGMKQQIIFNSFF